MKQRIYYYFFGILLFIACAVLVFSCGNDKQTEQVETIVWDTAAAFCSDSTVEMDDVYIPDFRQEDNVFNLTAFIIQPGVYSSYYVTKNMTNAKWYTLTQSNGTCSIEQQKIDFGTEVGEYEDTFRSVSGKIESEIHLANISNIITGAIESITLDTNVLAAGKNLYFDYGDVHYRLYALGYANGDKTIIKNYRLILEAQKDGAVTQQTLFAHSYYGHYRSCIVEFAGDIDSDGLPDMIIRDAEPDGSTIMLYLSSEAEGGSLLKLSAFHRSFVEMGC